MCYVGRCDAGNLTLGQYLNQWLDGIHRTVRPTTYRRYESIVRVHIEPALGSMRLEVITPAHLRALYRSKLDSGLSARSAKYVHATLHKALSDAAADHLIPRNVAATVKAPRGAKREINPLSPDEARRFLSAARGERFEALYTLAFTTGMRQGELLGPSWKDVELQNGVLRVRTSLANLSGVRTLSTPKTPKSRRSVRITSRAASALKDQRVRQDKDRALAGRAWVDHNLVFASRVGTPLDAQNLTSRSFLPLLEKAGLPRIRFHDLRHTCATLLLVQDVHPKVVQELLGHSTIAMTLDTYSHFVPDMQDKAVSAMNDALPDDDGVGGVGGAGDEDIW